MLGLLTTLFNNRKLLGYVGIGLTVFFLICYIGILKFQISNLRDDKHELELKNQALIISTENLMNSLNAQNQAVEKLNSKLMNTKNELSLTIKRLNSEIETQNLILDKEYKQIKELSESEAIQWLKNRRY